MRTLQVFPICDVYVSQNAENKQTSQLSFSRKQFYQCQTNDNDFVTKSKYQSRNVCFVLYSQLLFCIFL